MKINKNKKYIMVVLIMLLIITIVSIKSLMKDNSKSLPETNEINNPKRFAVMVQNETGYEEYISKDNKWPGEGYKFKEAKCVDNKGSKIDSNIVKYNNGKVTLTTNKTVYCTLYFDKKTTINALDIVASKPKSLSPNPDQGDMYRYQGTSELVNDNYICFGTKESEECTNDKDHYMYRIIGITPEGEMKLIKQTPVKELGNNRFSWYKATGTSEQGFTLYGTVEKGFDIWPESLIYKRLNGLSNGTTPGDGNSANLSTNKNINADTNIFVDSYTNEYPYMKRESEWYKIISDHEWTYGDSDEEIYDGHKMYQIETGEIETKCTTYDQLNGYNHNAICQWNKETDKVTAKIGLPYLHDILLSYFDGNDEKSRGIPGQSTFNYWITTNAEEFYATNSRCQNTLDDSYPSLWMAIRTFKNTGVNYKCNVVVVNQHAYGLSILPTFYLPNTIEMEGTGIETDPYVIVN